MSIFNSLGSNYSASEIWRAFFGIGSKTATQELTGELEKTYAGKALLTYKGREALQLAVKLSDLPKGSAVAINGFTCYAVYRAVTYAGCEAEFVDIEPGGLQFSATQLEQAVSKNAKVKAVIIQNTLGVPCDIAGIEKVCKEHGLVLIEDLAHGVKTKYADGREVGTVGDFAMLSFGRDKLIDAVSGGALVVRTGKYQKLDQFRLSKPPASARMRDCLYPILTWKVRVFYGIFGIGKLLHSLFKKLGLLSRSVDAEYYEGHAISAWQARLALNQFKDLSSELSRRQNLAKVYADNFDSSVQLLASSKLAKSSCLRFPAVVKDRDKVFAELAKQCIYITDTWYDTPIAPPRYMSATTYKTGQCPNAEKLCRQIINLPTHRQITPGLAQKISEVINQCQQ
ncbi:DegT/DnrJ/EryC1/StrS aminotransferase family protein [Candidatus Saccharibacteria bacterium]|nr:DegT/DnrJ/EryC1/StrS aminotransferase family protein [Candidatus Saccharibacteria bacterium]